MMKKWFEMKKKEIELKLTLYRALTGLVENQKELFQLAENFYHTFQEIPADEWKDELIEKLSALAHEDALQHRNTNN